MPFGPGTEADGLDEGDVQGDVELRRITVPAQWHGERLDRCLANLVPEFSRSYLQQLIGSEAVQVNGKPAIKPAQKTKAGETIAIELRPTPQSEAFKPEKMALQVVFEDQFLMVINKPAGLVVHPAPGNWSGTLLNGLLAYDGHASKLPRAGIVHRLDKDTSGLMVVARTRSTMDHLVELIAARQVSRQYLAVAHAKWKGAATRRVELPIGRDPRNRLKMAVVDLDRTTGKPAATDFSLLANGAGHCLVQCRLHTGRTHQIRVHMAALGHSLVADETYGGKCDGGLQRQALHAYRLAFKHPHTGENLEFQSLPPDDIQAVLRELGLIYTFS